MLDVFPRVTRFGDWRAAGAVLACVLSLLVSEMAMGATPLAWTDPLFDRAWELTPIPQEFLLHFDSDPLLGTGENLDLLLTAADITPLEDYRPRTRTLRVRAEAASAEHLALTLTDLLKSRNGPFVVTVSPVVRDGEGFTKFFRPDQFMVHFDSALSLPEIHDRIDAAGLAVVRDYWTPGLFRLTLPASAGLSSTIQTWADRADVRFAEPAYLCFDDLLSSAAAAAGTSSIPDDPLFPNQWGFRNPGNGSWKTTADVAADAAWWIETGDPDVIIAYIDTGADLTHEDLAANLLPQDGEDWNFEDPDSEAPIDILNHGTAVAGIGSAVQNNALGVSGLAPACRFMPLRVSLDAGDYAERVDAINYAASRLPEFSAMILNCSWGSSSGDFTAQRLAIEDASAAGCVLVCASGNSDDAVIYPARYPETIAVGASSPCDERTQSTSCDGESFWGSCFGPELDVIAPGVRIQTTDRTGSLGYTSTNYHSGFNGTSSSAPLVSATIALLYSVDPGLSAADARGLLQAGADDEVGRVEEDVPGFDIYHGYGRVNAYRSLVLATHPEGIEDDLESGAPGWKHFPFSSASDPWTLSSTDNHSAGGTFSWNSAEESTGVYPPGAYAALYIPDFWVPTEGRLRFWHRIDAEEFAPGVAADGGRIEISSDGGETWDALTPESGYTHVTGLLSDPFPISTPLYSGQFDWIEAEADLSALANGPVRIRFVFGSRADLDPEAAGSGWWVDDVRIEVGPSSVPETQLSTNGKRFWMSAPSVVVGPSSVQFGWRNDATSSGSVRWTLFGTDGRVLGSETLRVAGSGPQAFTFDPVHVADRPLSSGVYFLRLSSGAESAQQKLTVLR